MSDGQVKFVLGEQDIPTHWVNLMADLPSDGPPPLHPGTKQPAGPDDLAPLFPMALIEQEVSAAELIEIPSEVRDAYRLWRPTPLFRARRLESALDTPAHIYYKYEGGSPPGSHKPNTAVPQAYENSAAGVRKLTTETGAGQWGSALAPGDDGRRRDGPRSATQLPPPPPAGRFGVGGRRHARRSSRFRAGSAARGVCAGVRRLRQRGAPAAGAGPRLSRVRRQSRAGGR